MEIFGFFYLTSSAILCVFFLFCLWKNNRNSPPITVWPVFGMLPGLLRNVWRLHDFAAEVLQKGGGTFEFIGPWFSNFDFLVTCDPVNVNHILSKNFGNYGKGTEFKEIFEPLGEGIFNADSHSWRFQRKMIQAMVKNSKFELYLSHVVYEKVMNNLIPVLQHFAENKKEVDLQDMFQRFTFDNVCLLVLGFDPKCLSSELPEVLYEKAFDDIEEGILHRHVVPSKVWKILKWLEIGEEKKLKIAWETFDRFLYDCISRKLEEVRNKRDHEEEVEFDLLTAFIVEGGDDFLKSNDLLKDIALNLMAAGRDTVKSAISWFFWVVATSPSVESKILEEIKSELPLDEDISNQLKLLSTKDLMNKFVYLHAAMCETLRLYPSVPINEKAAIEVDTLPTGHKVGPNKRVLIPFYAMARMAEVWGEDYLEFKPERWISDKGCLIHVPSYKFSAFNAGPRTCLGKDMTFIQMKIVAILVLWHYKIRVVEGCIVSPSNSIVLSMINGFKVRVAKRLV
ncbi:hypothetical protein ACFE04_010102 [Oxalis oulophora]